MIPQDPEIELLVGVGESFPGKTHLVVAVREATTPEEG